MTHPALREFIDACDGFIAASGRASAMAPLVSARMRIVALGLPADAPWAALLRVIVGLATAAQESVNREERLDAIAEIMAGALGAWRGDLGDNVMRAPKGPAAAINQYKD